MNIILLGAPGAGKGTQAEKICEYCHIPQISTGNIIRAAMKNGTEAGQKAQEFVHAGKLVPDAVVIEMVNERLKQDDCKNGFILDGFPRTVPQAEALDRMGIVIDRVIDIEVPDEKIEARMSGRRVRSIRMRRSTTLFTTPTERLRNTNGTTSTGTGSCVNTCGTPTIRWQRRIRVRGTQIPAATFNWLSPGTIS